jgi:protein tyrosine kinase modulator
MTQRISVTEEAASGFSIERAAAGWRRRRWIATLAFSVPLVTGGSLVVFLPNIYRSAATVVVEGQQVPETFVHSTVTSALETRLQTISQEVLSRSRLADLITRFDLYPKLRTRIPFEDVIDRVRRDIKLELKAVETKGLREATVAFTISYLGSDPTTVSRVANTLASFYIEENLRARARQATGTADFLKRQLEGTKKQLDAQEQRVSEFKRRYLGELPQQMESNLATLEGLYTQLRLNADNTTRAVERRQALSSQLAEGEVLLASSSAGTSAAPGTPAASNETPEARLDRLKHELTRLRTQFSEKYPDVVRLTAEVATAERELGEAKLRPPGPAATPAASASQAGSLTPYILRLKEALSETETDIKVLKADEKRLQAEIDTYRGRVEKVPRREQEFRELSRDYESTRELYQSLLKRYEEARLAENMEQGQKGEQFRILDPAVPPRAAAAPMRLRLLAGVFVAALGLAVGTVMLAERVDTSFHTIDDLRRFSLVPVLVSIPRITTTGDLRRRQWQRHLAAGAAIVGLVMIVGLVYFAANGNERLTSLLAGGGGS